MIWGNLARQIGAIVTSSAVLATALIPVFGIVWGIEAISPIGKDRVKSALYRLRNSSAPKLAYGRTIRTGVLPAQRFFLVFFVSARASGAIFRLGRGYSFVYTPAIPRGFFAYGPRESDAGGGSARSLAIPCAR